jgi:CHAT domain-containing protein
MPCGWALAAALLAVGGAASQVAACSHAPAQTPPPRHARLLAALAAAGWDEERFADVMAPPPAHPAPKAPAPRFRLVPGLHRDVVSIARQVEAGRSPRDAWDRALVAALVGRWEQAIASLVAATTSAPRLAGPPNDLAALYLARARREDHPEDLLAALEAAGEALRRAPADLPAQYNRALALQRLGLAPSARGAWRIYLQRDPRSAWAERARLHLARLDRASEPLPRTAVRAQLADAARRGRTADLAAIVARSPQAARELAESEALTAWGAAWQAGDDRAARAWLAVARGVGDGLATRGGEHLTADAVAVIDGALAAPHAARDRGHAASLASLAAGHRAYGDGVGAFARGQFEAAARRLALAERLLARAASPFAARAAYEGARCVYFRSDYDLVLDTLEPLLRPAGAGRRSPALRAGCLRLRGLIRLLRMDPSGALADLTSAATLLGGLGEAGNASSVQTMIGTALDNLGDSATAWRHLHLGLLAARAAGDPAPLNGAYGESVEAALRLGHPQAALAFADEYVDQARTGAALPVRIGSLLLRAACHVELHGAAAADADLAGARPLINRLEDMGQRRSLLGDLYYAAGRAALLTSARRALRTLDQAVAIYERNDYRLLLAALLAERARARLAAGDDAGAEADLAAAIGERERQRRQVTDAEHRIGFFTRDRALFDEMVNLQLARGRPDLAFEYAERGRARGLLDAALGQGDQRAADTPGAAAPLRARDLAARLPRGVTLIEYQIFADRAMAWCARRGSAPALHAMAATPFALTRAVADLRRALGAGHDAAAAAMAGTLYEILLAPLLAEVPARDRLVIVPDGALHDLPFPLLRDPRTGRFLIASHVVSLAPSAALYLRACDRARGLARLAAGSSLVVLDPAFDVAAFPALPRLVGTGADARALARLGLPMITLSGEEATAERFLDVASRSSVVHFGGHAVVNPANGMLSALVLAPHFGNSGALYARDLWRRRLARTRLVVLAACDALGGSEDAGEGVISLGRGFLAAGVPAVVASVAPIPDEGFSAFFDAFYSRLATGVDVATALAATQLACYEAGTGEAGPCRAEICGQFELVGAPTQVYGARAP